MNTAIVSLPAATLRADGSPTTTSLLRLAASGGRSDRLRIALTAVGSASATILLLLAASVAFISEGDGPYRLDVLDQPGLRPGVMVAMLMLCVPVVVFVGLCTRVGAPGRDRRLAMLRMAGATPSEVTRIAALETAIATALGTIAGTIAFLVGRALIDTSAPGSFTIQLADGSTRGEEGLTQLLPTDVTIPIVAFVAIALVIVGLSTVASSIALRKVRISPFGVTRLTPKDPPTARAAILFALGVGGLIGVGGLAQSASEINTALVLASFALFVMCAAGLVLGGASISSQLGQFIAPRTSSAALLIASRRMIAAPYTASRSTTAVLIAVLIGGAVQGTRVAVVAGSDPTETFYADTFTLIDGVLVAAIALAAASLLITSAEAVVERRRTLAVLSASGTPRSTLARAIMMETLVPLVPTVLVSAAAGLAAARAFFGTTASTFVYDASGNGSPVTVGVPIPWERLGVLCGATIGICLALTLLSLVFLRRSSTPGELRAAA